MTKMRLEMHDLHGTGEVECEVYELVPAEPDPWAAVTTIPCPVAGCGQTVVWYEAGYVPGYRVCMMPRGNVYDHSTLRHRFLAGPDLRHPILIRDAEAEAERAAASAFGRRGGRSGRGEAKRRGDSAYYRALRRMGGYTVSVQQSAGSRVVVQVSSLAEAKRRGRQAWDEHTCRWVKISGGGRSWTATRRQAAGMRWHR